MNIFYCFHMKSVLNIFLPSKCVDFYIALTKIPEVIPPTTFLLGAPPSDPLRREKGRVESLLHGYTARFYVHPPTSKSYKLDDTNLRWQINHCLSTSTERGQYYLWGGAPTFFKLGSNR
jgi:hypothetical protein